MTTRTTVRTNPDTGVTEEIGYFGDAPQMMGWAHIPPGDVRGGVLVLSSTHAEMLKAYHLEVQLARELAAKGIAVQRFHYRGDGNSEGDAELLTLEAMVSAGREAFERLRDRVEFESTGLAGVRLGCYPAAQLSAELSADAMMLWDPVLDTDRFFNEAIRSHAISALKGEAKPEKPDAMLERLYREGSIELLGYEITSAFHQSITDRHLVDTSPGTATVFLVPFGSTDLSTLVDGWSSQGVDVSTLDGTQREAWWLDEQANDDRHQRSKVLVSGSASWMAGQLIDHPSA